MAEFSKRLNSWAGMTGKKGPGFCAICGDFGNLTRDHVPPKGCVEITNAVLSRLPMEAGPGTTSSTIHIQGGLKFKTICGHCNNELLGLKYDPELKLFVDGVRTALNNASRNVVLPRIVKAEANLHLVARSVIGHVLAAHSVAETQKKRDDLGASEELRQYFLNPNLPFPDDWRLYCWPYFSRKQIILRHAGWMDTSLSDPGNKTVYGHLLKFLPLAFWLVHKQPIEFNIVPKEITPAGPFDTMRAMVAFDLRHTPHSSYPENPTGDYILLFANEQSSVSAPVINKRAERGNM